MEERRHERRQRTLKAGKIIFNNRNSIFDCLVRDLSDTGACLQVNSSLGLPREFDLDVDGRSRPSRVVWATETRAGIEFSHPNVSRGQAPSIASNENAPGDQITIDELTALRAALDLVPIGIVLLDAEMRARFINRAFRDIWRIPDEMANTRPPFVALLYYCRDTRAYAVRPDHIQMGSWVHGSYSRLST